MLLRVAMKPSLGRRPLSMESRAGLGAASVLLLLVSAVELADGGKANYIGLLAAAPFLAAAFSSWREVLAVGAVATVLGVLFGLLSGASPMAPIMVNIGGVVLATGIGAAVGAIRERQAERLATLSQLADVAQGAVLRPIEPQIGPLAVAARYISASAAANIGGDLYEALDTPYGVRMIIGDVKGQGLDAVRLASIVLGSYRHVAYERADLRAIVADLDRAVARSLGEEDFVTAALVEERGGTLTIVNCGHPSPLLLRRGDVIELDPPAPAPRRVLPDRRAGLGAARPRYGGRRPEVAGERAGGVGRRPARRRHRAGAHGVRRSAGRPSRGTQLGDRRQRLARPRLTTAPPTPRSPQ